MAAAAAAAGGHALRLPRAGRSRGASARRARWSSNSGREASLQQLLARLSRSRTARAAAPARHNGARGCRHACAAAARVGAAGAARQQLHSRAAWAPTGQPAPRAAGATRAAAAAATRGRGASARAPGAAGPPRRSSAAGRRGFPARQPCTANCPACAARAALLTRLRPRLLRRRCALTPSASPPKGACCRRACAASRLCKVAGCIEP